MTVVAPGVIDFGTVALSLDEVAKILQGFVDRGSLLNTVSWTDPDTRVIANTDKANLKNVSDCINAGMKLFDAIVWLKSDKKKDLQEDASINANELTPNSEIARAVFYNYFFLLTQARYPGTGDKTQVDQVPRFLTVLLKMTRGQTYYRDLICGFENEKFNPGWIKYYKVKALGQESRTRFGLGVAGYRLVGPYKYENPDKEGHDKHAAAISLAKKIAESPPDWNIHPITRSPAFLSAVGNFNDNLNNLLLVSYTTETLQRMVETKTLYTMPVYNPKHQNWKTWTLETWTNFETPIFPQ